jgi:hypothetical protein
MSLFYFFSVKKYKKHELKIKKKYYDFISINANKNKNENQGEACHSIVLPILFLQLIISNLAYFIL